MAKKIQLTIPKPCHEDWNAMTPVEKGKFCGSCQKQVVDFSTMSDRQVAEFFKKPSTGSVCGRFMTDQLDRTLEIPKKRIPWLRYFFTIALPAFFLSIKTSATRTQGEPKIRNVDADSTRPSIYDDMRVMGMVSRPPVFQPIAKDTIKKPVQKPTCSDQVMGKPALETIKGEIDVTAPKDWIEVRGKVTDESGSPIPVASIVVQGTKTGVAANDKGEFRLRVKRGAILRVSAVNAETAMVTINGQEPLLIALKSSMQNEVVIVAGYVSVRRTNEINYKGMVVDEDNQPVVNAKISCGKKATYSDKDGRFGFWDTPAKNNGKLIITAPGYQELEYNLASSKYTSNPIHLLLKKKTTLPPVAIINKLEVFPNPVPAGAAISIAWKQTDAGYFQMEKNSTTGQLAYSKVLWIDAEARLLNLELPSLATGTYVLTLTNKQSGKKYAEKLVIQ